MIALYRRLIRKVQTVNQINRINIALGSRMTPCELQVLRDSFSLEIRPWRVAFYKCLREMRHHFPLFFIPGWRHFDTSLAVLNWVSRLDYACTKSGVISPEPFVRRRLRRQIKMYSSGGDRSRKILAICFGGDAQLLMMPMPVFLQHVDASRVDVVFLNDYKKNGFRSGIEGVATSLERLIDELQNILKINEYRRVVSIGTSGGGVPAVLTAVKLGLDAGLSVGGNAPDDPRWLKNCGRSAGELLLEFTRRAPKKPRLFLLYGADMPKDKVAAEALAATASAELVAIADPVEPVGHNALYPLVKQGRLKAFLETTVFDPLPK